MTVVTKKEYRYCGGCGMLRPVERFAERARDCGDCVDRRIRRWTGRPEGTER